MVDRNPSTAAGQPAAYRLAGFEVDLARLELRDANGARVDIPKLAFDLLLFLIEHRDRVVLKEELFQSLWGGVTVSANSLSQGIWAVRRALRDTGGAQRVIRNVRGRGYQLCADVEVVAKQPAHAIADRPSRPKGFTAPAASGFVGRGPELAQLRRILDDALAGRGRSCVITGLPGMGKTRLGLVLAGAASAAGALVCEARCFADAGTPPFWPLQQIARTLIRQQPPAELADLVGEGAGDLAKLIPELHEGIPNLPSAPVREPGRERFQLFDTLQGLLARYAHRTPLLLLIDDLHAADDSTLRFLEFLAPTLERMRVLLLCTARLGTGNRALEAAIANLLRPPGSLQIELSGLSSSESAALLRMHDVRQTGDQLVQRVLDLTDGNPFFITGIARWLAANKGAAPDGPLELPVEARSVLRQQIGNLPASCLSLLQLAAVLGQSVHVTDLRRVSEMRPEEVLEQLEPAFDSRILREDAEDVGTFHFTHPTIRETLYADMPRSLRVRLHLKAATALARAHADDPTPRLTELARHYYEAATAGCAAEAVQYGRLAAERAYAATAFEESVVHYRRALHALELTEPLDERMRCELLLGLGQSLRGTGAQVAEVRKVFAEAADSAKRLGDTHLLCEAAMRHAGRGPVRVQVLRELGTLDPAEIELLECALQQLGDGNSAEHALVSAWLAVSLYYSERREERKLRSSRAVAIARAVGDPAVLAECLMLRQYSVRGPGELDARIATLTETIELAGRIGARGLQLDAHSERAWASCERGDLNQAEGDMLAVERLADELRQPTEKRMALLWRARRLDAEGRFEEAGKLLWSLWGNVPIDQGNQGMAVRDLALHYFRGRADEGLALLESMVARYPLVVGWRCGLAASYAEAGRMAEAQRELDRLAPGDFACIVDDHAWVSSFTRLAAAAVLLGDVQRCATIYDKLAPYADRVCLIGHYGLMRGVVHRSLGELSHVMRDFARAEEHLERAIDLDTLAGMPLWAAFGRLAYAALLLDRDDRGDRKEAFRQLSAALSFARACNIAVLVQQAEALSARLAEQKSIRGRA